MSSRQSPVNSKGSHSSLTSPSTKPKQKPKTKQKIPQLGNEMVKVANSSSAIPHRKVAKFDGLQPELKYLLYLKSITLDQATIISSLLFQELLPTLPSFTLISLQSFLAPT